MLVDLALVGFGNVARRFVRLLDERRELLIEQYDLSCRVTGIATRRHGATYNPDGLDAVLAARTVEAGGSLANFARRTTDVPAKSSETVIEALGHSAAARRVLIETTTLDIGAGQPAIDHVMQALQAGCNVVTANKGPAAFAYHELAQIAAKQGLAFLFEGAVMDGVPIFNLARETLPAVGILGFRGVVNSTTNHILTALEDGEPYDEALTRMQEAGIAEADPSLDVDGWDAAAKTAALANVFLDARITPHDVDRSGISPADAARVRSAPARGTRIRLVASGGRGARARVELVELPQSDLLAGLRGMANALVLETDTLGSIAITQLDGGLTQTAYALLSDLIAIRRRPQDHG
jgi:homoserine dehydrogenase